jgi:hypothetical protein
VGKTLHNYLKYSSTPFPAILGASSKNCLAEHKAEMEIALELKLTTLKLILPGTLPNINLLQKFPLLGQLEKTKTIDRMCSNGGSGGASGGGKSPAASALLSPTVTVNTKIRGYSKGNFTASIFRAALSQLFYLPLDSVQVKTVDGAAPEMNLVTGMTPICTEQCDYDAFCDGTTCTCNVGFTGDGISCSMPVPDGLSCSLCDTNAQCSPDKKCTCNVGYFDAYNDGSLCLVLDICQWCDQDATCSEGKCSCNAGYSGDGEMCYQSQSSGDCSECDGQNADCVNQVCKCKSGYIDIYSDGSYCSLDDGASGDDAGDDGTRSGTLLSLETGGIDLVNASRVSPAVITVTRYWSNHSALFPLFDVAFRAFS